MFFKSSTISFNSLCIFLVAFFTSSCFCVDVALKSFIRCFICVSYFLFQSFISCLIARSYIFNSFINISYICFVAKFYRNVIHAALYLFNRCCVGCNISFVLCDICRIGCNVSFVLFNRCCISCNVSFVLFNRCRIGCNISFVLCDICCINCNVCCIGCDVSFVLCDIFLCLFDITSSLTNFVSQIFKTYIASFNIAISSEDISSSRNLSSGYQSATCHSTLCNYITGSCKATSMYFAFSRNASRTFFVDDHISIITAATYSESTVTINSYCSICKYAALCNHCAVSINFKQAISCFQFAIFTHCNFSIIVVMSAYINTRIVNSCRIKTNSNAFFVDDYLLFFAFIYYNLASYTSFTSNSFNVLSFSFQCSQVSSTSCNHFIYYAAKSINVTLQSYVCCITYFCFFCIIFCTFACFECNCCVTVYYFFSNSFLTSICFRGDSCIKIRSSFS